MLVIAVSMDFMILKFQTLGLQMAAVVEIRDSPSL